MTGWILLYKRLFNNKLVGVKKPYSCFEAWVWLLLEACRKKDGRSFNLTIGGKSRHFKEVYGQLTHSQRFMAEAWGWSQKAVQTYIRHLENALPPMITRTQNQQMTQITICKFDDYQNPSISKGISTASASLSLTEKRQDFAQENSITKGIESDTDNIELKDKEESVKASAQHQHSISTASNYNTLTRKQGKQTLPDEKLFQKLLECWTIWRRLKRGKSHAISERFNNAEQEQCRQLVTMTGGDNPDIIEDKMKIYLSQFDGFWSERKWPLAGFVQRFNEIDLIKEEAKPKLAPAPESEEIHSEWCEKDPCSCSPEYLKSKGFWKEGYGLREVNEMFKQLRKEFKDHGTKP